jgi:hypothetical protein
MDLASFLRDNQAAMAPIIEWGGAIFLTALVLSPFLIIRHRLFKPTRWWHIVGAYVGSFVLVAFTIWVFELADQWIIKNYLTTFELSAAVDDAFMYNFLLLLFLYPLSVFYSAKLLLGSLGGKNIITTSVVALLFTTILWVIAYNLFIYALGQAFTNLN